MFCDGRERQRGEEGEDFSSISQSSAGDLTNYEQVAQHLPVD